MSVITDICKNWFPNFPSIMKRTRCTDIQEKNYFLEPLIPSKHGYAVAKRFHPIAASHQHTGSVTIHDGRCGPKTGMAIQAQNLGRVPTIIILEITCISSSSRESLFALFTLSVRGHLSIPLLPLFLTMSICIPHGLYTYPTTSVPLRPPSDNQHSSLISWYSTILPTSSQPRLTPHNYHRPHWDGVTWPYGTLWWSLYFHIWKAWY
jgi:hypothetical protein